MIKIQFIYYYIQSQLYSNIEMIEIQCAFGNNYDRKENFIRLNERETKVKKHKSTNIKKEYVE